MNRSLRIRARRTAAVLALIVGVAAGALHAVDASLTTPDAPLDDVTFVCFDTETTGFSAANDRIVEIGAVKFRKGKILTQKSWVINPQIPIPERTQKIHGITDDLVKGRPTFAEVYPQFQEFIGDAVLVAHNARFDIRMVRAEALRNSMPLPSNNVIDSLKLFRRWYPESPSHKLSVIAKHVGVTGEGFHRAAADTLYTVLVIQKALEKHPDIDTYQELLIDAGGTLAF